MRLALSYLLQEPIMTDRVKALFDYTATNPEELDFSAGDIITVVGPSEESHFWWYGALKGKLGMFPFNFIVSYFHCQLQVSNSLSGPDSR
jgi:hypothetical protein